MQPSETTNPYYPVGVNLSGKTVLMVGAGQVAARKLKRLALIPVHIVIVAPSLSNVVKEIAEQPHNHATFHIIEGPYHHNLLQNHHPTLVFACTNQPHINHQISEDAKALGIWVNSATHGIDDSDFIVPGLIQYDNLQIALFSGGASPLFVRQLRESIEELVGPWVGQYLRLLQLARQEIQKSIADEALRKGVYEKIIADNTLLEQVKQGKAPYEELEKKLLQLTKP